MAMATVNRRWTIATWLLARADDHVDAVVATLGTLDADAIAVQSINRGHTDEIGAALGMHCVWACSYYRRTRLFPASAIGLAILTPHRIAFSDDHVVSGGRSTWSRSRRIAQTATVERSDHSGYTLNHAVERLDAHIPPDGAAPSIAIRPAQVGIADDRAIELPIGATTISSESQTPIDGLAAVLSVTFEMPWVAGDFPTS